MRERDYLNAQARGCIVDPTYQAGKRFFRCLFKHANGLKCENVQPLCEVINHLKLEHLNVATYECRVCSQRFNEHILYRIHNCDAPIGDPKISEPLPRQREVDVWRCVNVFVREATRDEKKQALEKKKEDARQKKTRTRTPCYEDNDTRDDEPVAAGPRQSRARSREVPQGFYDTSVRPPPAQPVGFVANPHLAAQNFGAAPPQQMEQQRQPGPSNGHQYRATSREPPPVYFNNSQPPPAQPFGILPNPPRQAWQHFGAPPPQQMNQPRQPNPSDGQNRWTTSREIPSEFFDPPPPPPASQPYGNFSAPIRPAAPAQPISQPPPPAAQPSFFSSQPSRPVTPPRSSKGGLNFVPPPLTASEQSVIDALNDVPAPAPANENPEPVPMSNGAPRQSRQGNPMSETSSDEKPSTFTLAIQLPSQMTRQRRSSVNYRSRGRTRSPFGTPNRDELQKEHDSMYENNSKPTRTVKVPAYRNSRLTGLIQDQPTITPRSRAKSPGGPLSNSHSFAPAPTVASSSSTLPTHSFANSSRPDVPPLVSHGPPPPAFNGSHQEQQQPSTSRAPAQTHHQNPPPERSRHAPQSSSCDQTSMSSLHSQAHLPSSIGAQPSRESSYNLRTRDQSSSSSQYHQRPSSSSRPSENSRRSQHSHPYRQEDNRHSGRERSHSGRDVHRYEDKYRQRKEQQRRRN